MKNITKKIIAAAVVLALLSALCPVSVFALEDGPVPIATSSEGLILHTQI